VIMTEIIKTKSAGSAGRWGHWIFLLVSALLLSTAVAAAPTSAAAAEGKQQDPPLTVKQSFNINGGGNPPDGTFEYRLTRQTPGAPMPEGAVGDSYTFTITGGTVSAPALRELLLDFGVSPGIYGYFISCVTPAPAHVDFTEHTVDRRLYRVELYVFSAFFSDNRAPIIVAYDESRKDEEDKGKVSEIIFTHSYRYAKPFALIEGRKAISADSGVSVPNTRFTFTLTELNSDDPDDIKPGGARRSAFIDNAGEFEFQPAIENLTVGTHYFRVQETIGGGAGWTNDDTARVVSVWVGDGPSEVSTYYTSGGGATFTNRYRQNTAEVTIGGTKVISSDPNVPVPETRFYFTLTELNSTAPDNVRQGGLTLTASRLGAGDFAFPDIRLEEGTHFFRVQETQGGSGNGGWDNDVTARVVTVSVSGNPMAASVNYTTGPRTFTNYYQAEQLDEPVIIRGRKVVSSDPDVSIPNEEFRFTLTELNSASFGDVKSGGAGRSASVINTGEFAFPEITGLAEGTYYFRVQETAGGESEGWDNDYDPRIVTVRVNDNSRAVYMAYTSGSRTFANYYGARIIFDEDGTPLGEWRYDEPTDQWIFDEYPPLAELPQTGQLNWPVPVLAGFGALLFFVGWALNRKRARDGRRN
jgi:LPXTG-motif cell wall-anchored protein